jgi:hypothetical protein
MHRKNKTLMTRIASRACGLRLLLAPASAGVSPCAPSGNSSRMTSTAPVVIGDTHAHPRFPPCRRRGRQDGRDVPPDLWARPILVGGEPARFGKGEYGKVKPIFSQ